MKKKLLTCTLIAFTLLTGCSPKTYPSLKLPYEIVNEDVKEIKDQGLKDYKNFQELENVTVREFTPEENEYFLGEMEFNTLNDLNAEYSVVEFNFGDTKYIHKPTKSLGKFDEDVSYFIYNDEIIKDDFYQRREYENIKLLRSKDSNGETSVYGEYFKDLKFIVPIKTILVKKGLQFKTTINDKVVYIDIK